jgi:hypothetical protein
MDDRGTAASNPGPGSLPMQNESAHTSELIEMANLPFQIHGRLSAGVTPSSTMTVFDPSIVAVESIPTNPFAFDTRRYKTANEPACQHSELRHDTPRADQSLPC